MTLNRNKIIGISAVILLAVLFIIFVIVTRPEVPAVEQGDNLGSATGQEIGSSATTTDALATSTTSTNGTVKKPVIRTAPGAVSQSYAEALKEYSASGYRFQFVNCKASPGSLTIKKGVTFMLDNRDNRSHKIKVGATTYSIGAYGYVIATAKTVGLNYILCDGGGTGRLQVQP